MEYCKYPSLYCRYCWFAGGEGGLVSPILSSSPTKYIHEIDGRPN